ncbi:unnamed protein product [Prorocentrum cordatum]|uniref:Calmodulin n=1 Tax=Prorocentrum cordatum TaxID=2364126 RepID=A0ABN9TKX4_9DINO|nr:unnamed protein product [Polarella glacialis]
MCQCIERPTQDEVIEVNVVDRQESIYSAPDPVLAQACTRPWVQAGLSREMYDHIVAEFVALDTNGDHVLNRREFERVSGLPEFLTMSRDDVSHLFDVVDADNNNVISMSEFVKYMAKRKDHFPLPAQVSPQRGRVEDIMKHFGFVFCTTDGGRLGVAGDGNCQFYSLCWNICQTTSRHEELRARIITHMRGPGRYYFENFYAPSHPSQPSTYDSYLNMMSKDKTWGDHLTLQAAAALYNLEVRLLTLRILLVSTRTAGMALKSLT